MLRLYCNHVATYVACNIKHQKSNITCLQHQNSTSATLKLNICNIQHQVRSSPLDTTPNITYLQHRSLMLGINMRFRNIQNNIRNIKKTASATFKKTTS
jgi:hypothetical protein